MIVLDTETTGVDVYNDRIVTLFIGQMNPAGYWEKQAHWLINPGVPIPEGAAAVHGISTETAVEKGDPDVTKVLRTAFSIIYRECIDNGQDLVVYNAPFDLTLLDSEAIRYGIDLPDRATSWLNEFTVLDPLVIDKQLNRYRKGSRKLVDVAPHYGVPVEANAHDAAADCLMAGRIAIKQLGHMRRRGDIDRGDLNLLQAGWHREQQQSFEAYKRRSEPDFVGQHGWPVYER